MLKFYVIDPRDTKDSLACEALSSQRSPTFKPSATNGTSDLNLYG